jgi:hypothetical protein
VALEFIIRKAKEVRRKWFLVYVGDDKVLGEILTSIKENTYLY